VPVDSSILILEINEGCVVPAAIPITRGKPCDVPTDPYGSLRMPNVSSSLNKSHTLYIRSIDLYTFR
jgi:hypothetical protein